MRAGWRDRFAFWLERFAWLEPFVFTYHGHTTHTNRPMYRNRINGHVRVGERR